MQNSPQTTGETSRALVNNDVCQYLRDSNETLQVDFLLENNRLWHLKPKLMEGANHHMAMDPLQQLLGDGLQPSYLSNCNPRNQLILCYILANSMLYLYPSSWLQTEWSSDRIYFLRRSNTSTSPVLTLPYISVELEDSNTPRDPPHHMQYHTHPAILALGIIFLEIVTGARFRKFPEPTTWQQRNRDNHQALQLLNDLERKDRNAGTKRISSGFSKVIRACLKLEPPPNFPSNQLVDEGPIRYYILSCIVSPLARELRDGHNLSLEDIQKYLAPEQYLENLPDIDDLNGISRRSTALSEKANRTCKSAMTTLDLLIQRQLLTSIS